MFDNREQKDYSDDLKEAWTEDDIELLSKHESLTRDDLIGAACDISTVSWPTGERYFKVLCNSVTGIFTVQQTKGRPVSLNTRYFNTLKQPPGFKKKGEPKKKVKHPTLRGDS